MTRSIAPADFEPRQWNDWRWQLRQLRRTAAEIGDATALTTDDAALIASGRGFEVGVTPYFASLFDPNDAMCPLRRQVVPSAAEADRAEFEKSDPLGEDAHLQMPGLVHKYPDRALLLVTDRCASYCRYCTRSRWVAGDSPGLGGDDLDAAIAYIAATPAIVDVLVSGGDPLLLSNRKLAEVLDRLSAIDHLRLIRIGTRVPVFLPMRIDDALAEVLRPRGKAIFVNVHINHARELAPDVVAALARIADVGVGLGGQTVLLRGVNDDIETLRATMLAMLAARVRPYYLFHCDPVVGTSHLRVPIARGLALMAGLIGHTTGMAVPKYVIDLDGAGKVPLWPDYVERIEAQTWMVRGYKGEVQPYPAG